MKQNKVTLFCVIFLFHFFQAYHAKCSEESSQNLEDTDQVMTEEDFIQFLMDLGEDDYVSFRDQTIQDLEAAVQEHDQDQALILVDKVIDTFEQEDIVNVFEILSSSDLEETVSYLAKNFSRSMLVSLNPEARKIASNSLLATYAKENALNFSELQDIVTDRVKFIKSLIGLARNLSSENELDKFALFILVDIEFLNPKLIAFLTSMIPDNLKEKSLMHLINEGVIDDEIIEFLPNKDKENIEQVLLEQSKKTEDFLIALLSNLDTPSQEEIAATLSAPASFQQALVEAAEKQNISLIFLLLQELDDLSLSEEEKNRYTWYNAGNESGHIIFFLFNFSVEEEKHLLRDTLLKSITAHGTHEGNPWIPQSAKSNILAFTEGEDLATTLYQEHLKQNPPENEFFIDYEMTIQKLTTEVQNFLRRTNSFPSDTKDLKALESHLTEKIAAGQLNITEEGQVTSIAEQWDHFYRSRGVKPIISSGL